MKVLVKNMTSYFYLRMGKAFLNTTRIYEATEKKTNPFGYVKFCIWGEKAFDFSKKS